VAPPDCAHQGADVRRGEEGKAQTQHHQCAGDIGQRRLAIEHGEHDDPGGCQRHAQAGHVASLHAVGQPARQR